MTGKVSGVQIIRSSNGPGGSSKIQLRGANSVTGLNQPLIVVDGVPMDNFTGASNNDIDNPTLDMGNGLSDINAEDIESMSVLKGASAAALYGSRAGNGVILITTKKEQSVKVWVSPSQVQFLLRQHLCSLNAKRPLDKVRMVCSIQLTAIAGDPEVTGQSYTKWDGTTANMQIFDNVKISLIQV